MSCLFVFDDVWLRVNHKPYWTLKAPVVDPEQLDLPGKWPWSFVKMRLFGICCLMICGSG